MWVELVDPAAPPPQTARTGERASKGARGPGAKGPAEAGAPWGMDAWLASGVTSLAWPFMTTSAVILAVGGQGAPSSGETAAAGGLAARSLRPPPDCCCYSAGPWGGGGFDCISHPSRPVLSPASQRSPELPGPAMSTVTRSQALHQPTPCPELNGPGDEAHDLLYNSTTRRLPGEAMQQPEEPGFEKSK